MKIEQLEYLIALDRDLRSLINTKEELERIINAKFPTGWVKPDKLRFTIELRTNYSQSFGLYNDGLTDLIMNDIRSNADKYMKAIDEAIEVIKKHIEKQ